MSIAVVAKPSVTTSELQTLGNQNAKLCFPQVKLKVRAYGNDLVMNAHGRQPGEAIGVGLLMKFAPRKEGDTEKGYLPITSDGIRKFERATGTKLSVMRQTKAANVVYFEFWI